MKKKIIFNLKIIIIVSVIIFCLIIVNMVDNEGKISKAIKIEQNMNIEILIKKDDIEKNNREIKQKEVISNILFEEQYAKLIIDKIGVNAPIFYGANDNIILNGVGHEEESYFPNQKGTIILCGHNYMNNFARFDELILGDIIKIQTDYGTFLYKFYDAKIVYETERDKVPIQTEEEILIIYTCYPLKSNGFTQYRYVVFAKKC